MNDEELLHTYKASRRGLPQSPDRPSLEAMQALVEGGVSGDEREALLDRVLADPAATRELAMLQTVAASRSRSRSWTTSRWLPLAAAAAVVIVAIPLALRPRHDARVYRAGDPGNAVIQVVSPADGTPLAPGAKLAWRSVADADRYVVEVVSSRGDALASLTTRDTTLVLPDSIPAARLRGAAGWMLVAYLRDGGQRQSVMRVTTSRAP